MTFFNHKLFFFFFFFICFGSATAQQEYLFSHLGTREGLASNDVTSVQQDKKGFIWIATFNGLQRYDGYRFLTFRHKADDTTSIPGNSVLTMRMDNKDRLWMMCDNNEIGYFDVTEFKYHPVKVRVNAEVLQKAERRLYIDEEDNVFLLLYGEPVMQYNDATNDFSSANTLISVPAKWHAIWLYQDKLEHNYWIACDSGLVKYNPKSKTRSYRNHNEDNDAVIEQYASLNTTLVPYLDSKGRFWILSWPAVGLTIHTYNIYTKKREQWQASLGKSLRYVYYEIDGIRELHDSTLWFNGNNVFATFNHKLNNFEVIQNNLPGEYSIRYDMVYHLYEDRENNIWVCTNKGLYRFNPSGQLFHTISIKHAGNDSLYTPDVSDIMETQSGELLVSTWGSGIFPYDSSLAPAHLTYAASSFKNGNQFTWCTHQLTNGDIWCGHQSGTLFIIHPTTNKTEKLQMPAFEGSTIRQMVEDKAGNLWFGTQNGLLVKWTAATNTFTQIQKNLSRVYRLYVDSSGDIWVCTKSNGVYKISASSGIIAQQYTASGADASHLTASGANDIIQYNDSLYIIAGGGLNILNSRTKTVRFLEINNDAFSNIITNIVKDKHGLLWVTTQNSLFSINIQNEAATNYTESDGLQNSNFNPATSCILKDGRIAFGTTHNFIVFNPDEVLQRDVAPTTVEITGLAVMNKWLPIDSIAKQRIIELPSDQNAVTITFSTLTYQRNYPILYKLEGLDKDWIRAKNNEAIYSYLPSGNYTFKIRAANANDVFSKEISTLKITVQAPFWRTWWFYSLVLLAGILFLYWLDRERMKRKAVLQNMRSNISGNLHEEINKSLQNINVLSEIARIKADKEPKQSQNYIDEIHHKSNSLIEAMDDMLWSIDPVNDTMAQTIHRMKEIAHTINYRCNASVQVHTDDKVIQLKPDMKRRHELMAIYKMALQLLAEQLQAHVIFVELSYIKSHVQLNIFAANAKLNNTSAVQETIRILKTKGSVVKGNLEVQADEKGVGITVSVKR